MTQTVRPFGRVEGRGWLFGPGRDRISRAVFWISALVLAAAGVAAGSGGTWLTTTILMLIALAFAGMALPRDRRRLEAVTFRGGLLLPARPTRTTTIVAWVVVGATMAAASTVALIEALALGRWHQVGWAVTGLLVGVLILVPARAGVRTRTVPHRGLLLTPDVVVLATRRPAMVVPWSEVVEIHDYWTRRSADGSETPSEGVHNWLSLELRAGPTPRTRWSRLAVLRHHPSMDPAGLAVDPYATLAVLRHYLAHPEARVELGTDVAVERFDALETEHAGDLPQG